MITFVLTNIRMSCDILLFLTPFTFADFFFPSDVVIAKQLFLHHQLLYDALQHFQQAKFTIL